MYFLIVIGDILASYVSLPEAMCFLYVIFILT